jgi:LacI family transcriptional regulator
MKEKSLKSKKTTIYDIANEVGTSTATVSRVLSNSGYPVSEELKRRIINTARKLNYSPNMVGRMLKKSGSMDIGVIIPTISNPFYPPIVLGIELEARKRGFNMLLCNSLRNPELERTSIETLCQKQVMGIIISTIDKSNVFIKEMQKYGVKFITFDQNIDNINKPVQEVMLHKLNR